MKTKNTFWYDWAKGMLLNVLYEGQAILLKLVLCCAGFFTLQLILGVRAVEASPSLYLEEGKSYISLSSVLDGTLLPYFFVAFLLLSLVGSAAYLFWKDTDKAQPYYALRTLPVPRSCSFWAKYLWMIFSVLSVYCTQILVLVALLHWPFRMVQFRAGEWLLSVSEGGFLTWFFPPDCRMFLVVTLFLLLITLVYVNALFFAGRITSNYISPVVILSGTFYTLFSHYPSDLNVSVCLIVSGLLWAAIALCLWDAYRHY